MRSEKTTASRLALFALVPAAGSGTRLAGAQPKQYLPLAGRPMLWHAVRALCGVEVENVFVVLAPGDTEFARHDWSAFGGRVEPLYCGGATRRDSVYNGLVAASAAVDVDDWMLVHDAARPCVPRADLAALVAECAADAIGGILALPIADTVKRAGKDEAGVQRVAATEDRTQLWLAQTPQMFRAGLLAQALRDAKGSVTDEASAIEQLGLRPRLVTGSRENLKVTYTEDLAIAAAILATR
ncbi:MAG: 2-C-methyl-D-erythritol 4-phosphate cytidylyltransferase [Betaproteobacteria bacterium RIFCSPLOWO2_12_FULL_67_28]|nr:MAG: 2-C-methyl-D-erythritol 4-phosphate cytidylyltransferase [Betaproteobacteria bacterium RIFCSPLOWO2_02_FULL_68_150]OGA65192.1 MAG: 2-C-methyl-D-erythritol 4-phosphate cytidylyltransferase [Betaproteobacteria bacterium RIFCSPLOWO2_12_FULL_67_28]